LQVAAASVLHLKQILFSLLFLPELSAAVKVKVTENLKLLLLAVLLQIAASVDKKIGIHFTVINIAYQQC